MERKQEKDPDLLRLQSMVTELGTTSNRAIVLLCAASIDRKLEELIRLYFKTVSGAGRKQIDELLKRQPLPPLGSFTVRAKVARLLGLLKPELASAICRLAEIRNRFAHREVPPQLTVRLVSTIYQRLPENYRNIIREACTPRRAKNSKLSSAQLRFWHTSMVLKLAIGIAKERIPTANPKG